MQPLGRLRARLWLCPSSSLEDGATQKYPVTGWVCLINYTGLRAPPQPRRGLLPGPGLDVYRARRGGGGTRGEERRRESAAGLSVMHEWEKVSFVCGLLDTRRRVFGQVGLLSPEPQRVQALQHWRDAPFRLTRTLLIGTRALPCVATKFMLPPVEVLGTFRTSSLRLSALSLLPPGTGRGPLPGLHTL